MDAVVLRNVTKTFGSHTAVDNLDLIVPKGSIYGFIGPNGSGKTTTIRMILHILHPDSGMIEVLGETQTRAANDRVGYLPEERGLYKKMKVRLLLQYYAALKGMSGRDARREGDAWLDRLDLAAWADKKVETLSKGMAQKIQFISTVIGKPELIILDEPFSGLDPVNLEVLRTAILDLHKQGSTIIFSTHDMSVAEKMCDFIFMIYKGQKVLDGSMDAIVEQYGQDSVRLRTEHGRAALDGLNGIEGIIDLGKYQEVRLRGDSQEFLMALASRTSIQLFEKTRPSLHDIFIRIAQPKDEELTHV